MRTQTHRTHELPQYQINIQMHSKLNANMYLCNAVHFHFVFIFFFGFDFLWQLVVVHFDSCGLVLSVTCEYNDNYMDLWDMSLFHSFINFSLQKKMLQHHFKWFNCFAHGNTWCSRFASLTTHTQTSDRAKIRQNAIFFTKQHTNHLKSHWSPFVRNRFKRDESEEKKLSFLPKAG